MHNSPEPSRSTPLSEPLPASCIFCSKPGCCPAPVLPMHGCCEFHAQRHSGNPARTYLRFAIPHMRPAVLPENSVPASAHLLPDGNPKPACPDFPDAGYWKPRFCRWQSSETGCLSDTPDWLPYYRFRSLLPHKCKYPLPGSGQCYFLHDPISYHLSNPQSARPEWKYHPGSHHRHCRLPSSVHAHPA